VCVKRPTLARGRQILGRRCFECAGRKYLGQWEERREKIIEELARVPSVLCVDRLLDLVRLGGTGPGDSLAAFMLPYLQRG
jgi:ATP-dependent Clp protease ATP-binding subunit ClpC